VFESSAYQQITRLGENDARIPKLSRHSDNRSGRLLQNSLWMISQCKRAILVIFCFGLAFGFAFALSCGSSWTWVWVGSWFETSEVGVRGATGGWRAHMVESIEVSISINIGLCSSAGIWIEGDDIFWSTGAEVEGISEPSRHCLSLTISSRTRMLPLRKRGWIVL